MSLLLEGRPIVITAELVRRVGMVEAAILQQLHYWSDRATCLHEGHAYVFKTYQDWSDEIGVSAKAARGALDRLRRDGLVVGMQNPTDPRDRTLWWRIDHAVLSGAPSDPGGSSGPPEGAGRPDRAGTSNAGASGSGSESTAQMTSKANARASASQSLPDGFPSELVEHARAVFVVCRSIAQANNAKEVTPRAVGHAIMSAPGRRYVEEAHKLAAWCEGTQKPIKDVVARYQRWLGNADTYAGVERLGALAVADGPNVHPIRGRRTTAADYQALKGTLG